jgi:uncharacterized protein (TIGR00661 family)
VRILYGVVGEGMGHAIRSRVVIAELIARGHEVAVMASQRAVDFLAAQFHNVHRIHGFHIVYEENRVRMGHTVWSNVLQGAAALPTQIRAYFDLVEEFEPEVVVSDFESWTYLFGKAHGLPILSVDNMQIINRCEHPPEVLDGERTSFELARAFIKSKLPFCDHYIVATFFRPPLRKSRTTLVPPILRPEILQARPTRGEHLLVYQTSEGHRALAEVLRATTIPCRVYGMLRSLKEDQVDGTLCFRPFSEQRFVQDLASARAVVAGGGFTLMSEAVYLHKPYLAVPVGGQFEQVLNARYLEREGYGRGAQAIDARTLGEFLEALPGCEARLAQYEQDGNQQLLETLDEHLDRAAAGLYG